MKLQLFGREHGTPSKQFTTMRDLSIGTGAPKALGGLFSNLGKMSTEIAMKVKAAEDTSEYAGKISSMKSQMAKFYSARSQEFGNHKTLVDDVGDYYKQSEMDLLEGVEDVVQRTRIKQGFTQIGLTYQKQSLSEATNQSISAVKGDHLVTRSGMLQEAAIGSDDQMRNVMENYASMTNTLQQSGVFEYEDMVKDVLSFANDSVRGKVRHLMNTDPEVAFEYLTNPESFAGLLKPEHRENLTAQAERLIGQIDAKKERDRKALDAQQVKLIKQQRDATYQQSYREIRDGTMSVDRMDALMNAGLYHKSDYSSLYKAMLNRNKEITGSPKIYDDMKQRMYMGNLSKREVLSAVNDEQINWNMADEMMTEIEAGAAVTQGEGYKTYLGALKTKLGWTVSGMFTNDQAVLIGNATIEFRNRAIAGEDLQVLFDDLSVRFSRSMVEIIEKSRFSSVEEAKAKLKPGYQLDRELMLQRIHMEREQEAIEQVKQKQEREREAANE